MKIITCLDKNNGMSFHGKRQSRDEVVIKDIVNFISENNYKLIMNENSYRLFLKYNSEINDMKSNFICYKDSEELYDDVDYCFVETFNIEKIKDEIKELIIYRWDKVYPSTIKFDVSCTTLDLFKADEIIGRSHEKIIREVYRKND